MFIPTILPYRNEIHAALATHITDIVAGSIMVIRCGTPYATFTLSSVDRLASSRCGTPAKPRSIKSANSAARDRLFFSAMAFNWRYFPSSIRVCSGFFIFC